MLQIMIKIFIQNRPYGFIYSEKLPAQGFTERRIPVIPNGVAVTGDYSDIADNHCAAVCAMNMMLILRKFGIGSLIQNREEQERRELFKDIHRIVGNGPVIFLKPKLNKIFRSIGAGLKTVPTTDFKDIEKCMIENRPVALLVNAGITQWHWITIVGIRKYMDGSIYFNILDGWNKRTDRYLKYIGRETYIRALMPVNEKE